MSDLIQLTNLAQESSYNELSATPVVMIPISEEIQRLDPTGRSTISLLPEIQTECIHQRSSGRQAQGGYAEVYSAMLQNSNGGYSKVALKEFMNLVKNEKDIKVSGSVIYVFSLPF